MKALLLLLTSPIAFIALMGIIGTLENCQNEEKSIPIAVFILIAFVAVWAKAAIRTDWKKWRKSRQLPDKINN